MMMQCSVREYEFGRLDDGRAVPAVALDNGAGFVATVIAYGARLQSVLLPDAKGSRTDVVLGYDDLAGYVGDPDYQGATVGRVANRLAGARLSLDGQTFPLDANDGANALHGGYSGFERALWTVEETGGEADAAWVRLGHVSSDGEGGYPGRLSVTATFTLDRAGRLAITYRATTDRPTIVNLSHHSYWNLAGADGAEDVADHRLTIGASAFLPTDDQSLPTGEKRACAGTPFDFREARRIGDALAGVEDPQIARAAGYDHCWALDVASPGGMARIARLAHPASGRGFDLWSDQPGLQVYSGNWLSGVGKGGRPHRRHGGVALEPQHFPDTPRHPSFGSIRLDPCQVYENRMRFDFLNGDV